MATVEERLSALESSVSAIRGDGVERACDRMDALDADHAALVAHIAALQAQADRIAASVIEHEDECFVAEDGMVAKDASHKRSVRLDARWVKRGNASKL